MINNFLDLLKRGLKSYTSLMKPLIFIFVLIIFSRTETTIANNSVIPYKNENESSAPANTQNSQIGGVDADGTYYEQTGGSSWYSHIFHNRTTSSGERYKKDRLTAAHKKLPFGSIVKITNTSNGKTTFVRINDRGPFHKRRIIDLSHKTAVELGALGNPKVSIETYIPEKSFANDEKADNYFIAYSHDEKPQLLPNSRFSIISEYDDFDEAVESLDNKALYYGQLYLLVEPDNSANNDGNDRYYIGYKKIDILNNPMQLLQILSAK